MIKIRRSDIAKPKNKQKHSKTSEIQSLSIVKSGHDNIFYSHWNYTYVLSSIIK